jgi:hypothetical protein
MNILATDRDPQPQVDHLFRYGSCGVRGAKSALHCASGPLRPLVRYRCPRTAARVQP